MSLARPALLRASPLRPDVGQAQHGQEGRGEEGTMMGPPAARDPFIWAAVIVGVALIIASTKLYWPIEAIEQRLGLPTLPGGMRLRIAGVITGVLVLVAASVFVWLA